MERAKRKIAITIIVLVLGPVIFYIAVQFIGNIWMLRSITPEVAREYKAWTNRPITLPTDALAVAPFQKETVAAAETFRKTYAAAQQKLDELINGAPGHPKESFQKIYDPAYKIPLRAMDEVTSVATAFEALVQRSDYQLDAVVADLIYKEYAKSLPWAAGGYPLPGCTRIDHAARLVAMQAVRLAQGGNQAGALAKAKTIVRAAKTSRYSDRNTESSGIIAYSIGTTAWAFAVDHCDDPRLLEENLKDMNALVPSLSFFPDQTNLAIKGNQNVIAGLRWLKRQGRAIPSCQGVTGTELWWRYYVTLAEFQQEVVEPAFAKDPNQLFKLKDVQDQIFDNLKMAYRMGPLRVPLELVKSDPLQAAQFVLMHEIIRKSTFAIESKIFGQDEYHRQFGNTAIARFNLLRLKTARKLYLLREGHDAPDAAALVPKYLREIPNDPFDPKDNTIRFDKLDYAVGPDGIDQKTMITYDPTNGALSAGDIVLR